MKHHIFIGCGGHARVLIGLVRLLDDKIVGVVDQDPQKDKGIPYLGDDDEILKYAVQDVSLINALGSVASLDKRKDIYTFWKQKGYSFSTLIHPKTFLDPSVEVHEGVQIMAGSVINPGCQIGENTIVNTGAIIDHDCVLGEHCHVAPGVTLSGGIHVGPSTHIGVGATVIQGVRIGSGCLVAAGAVVTQDVPDGVSVKGVPAEPF